jgi:hypothetical protein
MGIQGPAFVHQTEASPGVIQGPAFVHQIEGIPSTIQGPAFIHQIEGIPSTIQGPAFIHTVGSIMTISAPLVSADSQAYRGAIENADQLLTNEILSAVAARTLWANAGGAATSITVGGGTAGAGAGHTVTIRSGGGALAGGGITVEGGTTTGSGTPNSVLVKGGAASGTGNGGLLELQGGPAVAGNGGGVIVTGAPGLGTDKDGGDVSLVAGARSGSGVQGRVVFTSGETIYGLTAVGVAGPTLTTSASTIIEAINEIDGLASTADSLSATLGAGPTTGANNITVTTGQSITGADELTLVSTTTGTASLDSGTTGAVNLGTGASAKTVTVGSVTGAAATTIQSGSGSMIFTAGGIFDVNATGVVTIDGSTVTLTSAGVLSLDGTGIATSATTLTADAGLAIATTTTGALTLDSGTTGTISIGVDGTNAKTLNLDSGTTGALGIGTSAFAKTITLGNVTGATGMVYNAGSAGHSFTGDLNVAGGTLSLDSTSGAVGTVLHAETELTGMSGATATAASFIPAGALVLAISTRVTTTITGATSWDIGDGTDVDRWGAAIALTTAPPTTTDPTDYLDNTVTWQGSTAGDVVLTANGSNFTAGAVRIVVTYMSLTAPTA